MLETCLCHSNTILINVRLFILLLRLTMIGKEKIPEFEKIKLEYIDYKGVKYQFDKIIFKNMLDIMFYGYKAYISKLC